MKKIYPRILILGETFRKDTGGGITLINLFCDWPKKQIAIVTNQAIYSSPEYPASYYQLGRKEIKIKLQLLFLKNVTNSGIISPKQLCNPPATSIHGSLNKDSSRKIFIKLCINSLLFRYKLSKPLQKFIESFKPEYLYIQPNNYGFIVLSRYLIKRYKFKKVAIHFMDDFKFYKTDTSSIFVKWFYKRHFRLLKEIISKADNCMAISNLMSEEYGQLFQKKFNTFHNPVQIDQWNKPGFEKNINNKIEIVYSGRISVANYTAIMETIDAVDELSIKTGGQYSFRIYSPDKPTNMIDRIDHSNSIKFLGFKNQDEIKDIINSANIVLLPLSFEKEAFDRVYLSMPTKTAEYLACQAAILIYAPKNTALAKYATEKGFGYLVTERNHLKIIEGIQYLSKKTNREHFSKIALKLALSGHSLEAVSKKFVSSIRN
jgi:glycosyltransferase involved in cell wall biosynthesis